MLSTREVLAALRRANPSKSITEDRIRHELRSGRVPRPPTFAGRLMWSEEDLAALASALQLDIGP